MLKQMKYFQAVVRCGSFTEAAEECHISQSAISQQIQALEQELGISLLERRNRKFTVTSAGQHFYKKSLMLTADYEKMCRETIQIARGKDARICVGYLKGYSGGEFQQAVAEFTEKYQDVAIQIRKHGGGMGEERGLIWLEGFSDAQADEQFFPIKGTVV